MKLEFIKKKENKYSIVNTNSGTIGSIQLDPKDDTLKLHSVVPWAKLNTNTIEEILVFMKKLEES